MKLLLIDAYAMIYRAYYAFIRVPRMTSKGENTSAIFGFIVTLEDLLKRIHPTHLGVAFDPHGPTFRHEAYPQYKAQREETPEDIRKAVPQIKRILSAMNIPILEVPKYEADDVIGTMAKMAESEGFEVYMATPDKDYGQLVSEHIHMYRPRHTGGWDDMRESEVCEKYGLQNVNQVIDLLGLMGDASDNIPGCKGVGEKTAVQLLTTFGNIEELLQRTEELKGALKTKVESQVDDIRFSKFLATIKTDVPLKFDAQSLAISEPNFAELYPIYQELEFNSLLKNLPKEAKKVQEAPKQTISPGKKSTTQDFGPSLFDLAEESTDPKATSATAKTLETFAAPTLFDFAEETTVDNGRNEVENRIAAYLLNPEAGYQSGMKVDFERLQQDERLYKLFTDVEIPLATVLTDMQNAGVRFDVNLLHEAEHQMQEELNQIEKEILALAGIDFNINSPKQVGELLFEQLKLDPKAKKTKSGQYVTSEEVMTALKSKHPIVSKILDYRELKKLLSTYVSPLPSYINPETGKIHATYNQTVTATGRLSCSNPNLQNLPIRNERGKIIREAVIPNEGCAFLSADYSQIELRLMAHFSQDEHMLAAFRDGQDIHAATAAKIFDCPITEVSKDQRRKAKTANFGIIYGISAFGLAQQLDCSRSEAQQLINDYFAAFPKVTEFIERAKQSAREKGYVETLFGRKRYLPDINSHNSVVRSFAERNAVNAPIQGTAADIIKIAMVNIHKHLTEKGLHTQMIMQVHDELNFNVPTTEIEQVREIVTYEMQNVVSLSVPLIAECGIGKNWLEAH